MVPTTNMRFLLIALLMPAPAACIAAESGSARFSCGGSVEAEVWSSWDGGVHEFLKKDILQNRLVKQGDAYALYDFQTYVQNTVAMARRCNRLDRLIEIAALVQTAYGALESGGMFSKGRRWVCRGGKICGEKSRLFNTEVMLDSVQFLALATSVANALVSSGTGMDANNRRFIADTVSITREHLLRWADDSAIARLGQLAQARPEDVEDGSTKLLFTDKDLWMIAIYAELSGILQKSEKAGIKVDKLPATDEQRLQTHLKALLQLFASRISLRRMPNGKADAVVMADLDRGYWRLYEDNRYAAYEAGTGPVSCISSHEKGGQASTEVKRAPEIVEVRKDIGWDISHARRLVHVLDALDRNRDAIRQIFPACAAFLPSSGLASAYANTLVAVVWNHDADKPLFSNYWSGANGWYRVGYKGTDGQCREGYPPYGMSDAFVTGGYIAWGRYNPVIDRLGRRIYELAGASDENASTFINKNYPGLGNKAGAMKRALTRFMFLPALVK
jgi:hypothetical protein